MKDDNGPTNTEHNLDSINSVNLGLAGAKLRRSESFSTTQLRADLTWIVGIYQHPGSEASHHLHMARNKKDDKYHDDDDDDNNNNNNHVTTIC